MCTQDGRVAVGSGSNRNTQKRLKADRSSAQGKGDPLQPSKERRESVGICTSTGSYLVAC